MYFIHDNITSAKKITRTHTHEKNIIEISDYARNLLARLLLLLLLCHIQYLPDFIRMRMREDNIRTETVRQKQPTYPYKVE